MRHSLLAGLMIAATMVGSAAFAQEEGQPLPPCPKPQAEAPPPEAPPPVAEAAPQPAPTHRRWKVFAPSQIGLTTGGGVTDYFGTGQTAPLQVGPAWDARVAVGQRSILAGELGYVGSTNQVAAGDNTLGHLNSNGFDATLRVNLTPFRYQPYVFGGVGYNHVHVTEDSAEIRSMLRPDDDQFTVPAGGGMAFYLGRRQKAMIDLRGTYRFLDSTSLYVNHAVDQQGEHLHQWAAQARLGYQF
jgi:hypothetical protein